MFTIRLAENCGFCYGVKRAVTMAEKAADSQELSYTLGPIIHNPQVVGRLEDNGVYAINELSDVETGTIIIRSHGVGPEVYEEAETKRFTSYRCHLSTCAKSTKRCEVSC